ncbi:MAG: immunity 17 family protein [Oscillospiraceae bacterium]|jgi:hypothetical protein
MKIVIILAGVFTIAAGIFNWEWFFAHRKARFFVNAFGRNGARIFYGILGAAIAVLGVLTLTGIV